MHTDHSRNKIWKIIIGAYNVTLKNDEDDVKNLCSASWVSYMQRASNPIEPFSEFSYKHLSVYQDCRSPRSLAGNQLQEG